MAEKLYSRSILCFSNVSLLYSDLPFLESLQHELNFRVLLEVGKRLSMRPGIQCLSSNQEQTDSNQKYHSLIKRKKNKEKIFLKVAREKKLKLSQRRGRVEVYVMRLAIFQYLALARLARHF